MSKPIDLETFFYLLSDDGQRLLAELAATPIAPDTHLQLAGRLRQETSPQRASAILETLLLRQRAEAKFSRAAEMYFTRAALEQASAEIVANHRARRFAAAGMERIADLGCGVGGDSLAMAGGADVIGVDWDPLRLAMAQENVRVYGRGDRFHPLQADLLALTPLPVQAAFADPARRDERGRRLYSVNAYRPPLGRLQLWWEQLEGMAVKVSPAVDYAEIPAGAEVEFISAAGEVREAVLWFGAFRAGATRQATLLPSGESLDDRLPAGEVPVIAPQRYLYEPDKAVIRAHLVEQLAGRLNAAKIDDQIAYLTADEAYDTPFARRFLIEDALPFHLKRLRHYLRERNVGRVTVKKRGSPLDVDSFTRRLRLQGNEEKTLFLTQVNGEPYVLVANAQR